MATDAIINARRQIALAKIVEIGVDLSKILEVEPPEIYPTRMSEATNFREMRQIEIFASYLEAALPSIRQLSRTAKRLADQKAGKPAEEPTVEPVVTDQKPAEEAPVEEKPVEAPAVEQKPVDTKPAQTKTAKE